jgi:hypothetical protein
MYSLYKISKQFEKYINWFKKMLRSFTRLIKFNFVNLPLKSKYYHKQLPTQLP